MALEITDTNFEEIVMKSTVPVLVDFWAAWCGPCKAIAPVIEDLYKEYDGKCIVGKIDVDANPEVTAKFSVRNIPTILFFKNGEVVDKHVGNAVKGTLVDKIEGLL